MLADPRNSRIVLINLARSEPGGASARWAARWQESRLLLPAARQLFGVAVHSVGECPPADILVDLADSVTWLDVDALSLWRDQRFAAPLGMPDIGVIFIGGAWLEEEVLFAALEGVKLGYDVRLLVDLSLARCDSDGPHVLDRLALHGVLPTTIRQTLLEWAVCLDDPILKQRVRQLLS
jgi:nicotinamidase-related amidase